MSKNTISRKERAAIQEITEEIWMYKYPYQCSITFRGAKKDIAALLDAMLERVDRNTFGGRMYAAILTFGPFGYITPSLSRRFAQKKETAPTRFLSGGSFRSASALHIYEVHIDEGGKFEAEIEAFAQECLTLIPELECCMEIEGNYMEIEEVNSNLYFYSEAGTDQIFRKLISARPFPWDSRREFAKALELPESYIKELFSSEEMAEKTSILTDYLCKVRDKLLHETA